MICRMILLLKHLWLLMVVVTAGSALLQGFQIKRRVVVLLWGNIALAKVMKEDLAGLINYTESTVPTAMHTIEI